MIEFPDEDDPVVYQEGLFVDVYIEHPDLERYTIAFANAEDVALSSGQSLQMIKKLADS